MNEAEKRDLVYLFVNHGHRLNYDYHNFIYEDARNVAASSNKHEFHEEGFVGGKSVSAKIPKEHIKNVPDIVEVRPPYLRKLPNENPMIIDMVDRFGSEVAIDIQDVLVHSLKLAPNPESLIVNSSKKINRYNTMTRWVEEHWGDELDAISFNGSTFSFNIFNNNEKKGLPVKSRRDSVAYDYLRKMKAILETNGLIYQDSQTFFAPSESNLSDAISNKTILDCDKIAAWFPFAKVFLKLRRTDRSVDRLDTDLVFLKDEAQLHFLKKNPDISHSHPRRGLVQERVYIRISFDYLSVYGYFDSFDIMESSASPFRLTYSANFKAERTVWVLR